MIKNWLKAILVRHASELQDNGKTETKRRGAVRSPRRLESSGQAGGYERIYGGKDLWNRYVLKSGIEERGSDGWCDGGDR